MKSTSMKKRNLHYGRIIATLLMACLLAVSLVGGAAASATGTATALTEDQAKAIALEHAGITAEQATFIRAHLDRENGRTVYDVEFYSGDTEYDYEVDAETGDIREFDREIESYVIPGTATATQPAAEGTLDEADAKAIAFEHAGVTEDALTAFRVRIDHDRKRADRYEIDFSTADTRYEYEVDAQTGEILEFSQETERGTSAQTDRGGAQRTGETTDIGKEEALSIALARAGLAEADVQKLKVKLDREHGIRVYEVEFRNGRTEYAYDIDAATGEVVEADVEYED